MKKSFYFENFWKTKDIFFFKRKTFKKERVYFKKKLEKDFRKKAFS